MGLSRAIPVIATDQPDASRVFYEGVLGMRTAMEEDGFLMLASSSDPQIQIIVAWDSPSAWDPLALQLSLSVDVDTPEQLTEAHDACVAAGLDVIYPITDEPFGRRRFVVREPSGAAVNVACHI